MIRLRTTVDELGFKSYIFSRTTDPMTVATVVKNPKYPEYAVCTIKGNKMEGPEIFKNRESAAIYVWGCFAL